MREIISSTSESLHKKSRSCEYCVAVLSFSITYRLREKKVFYCLSSSITRCHSFRWGHEGSQPSGWTSCEEEEAETGKPRPVRYEQIHCRVVALYKCFSAVGCFSTDTRLSLSLLVPVITNLFLFVSSVSLCHQLQYVRLMKFLHQRGFTSTLLQPALFSGTTQHTHPLM